MPVKYLNDNKDNKPVEQPKQTGFSFFMKSKARENLPKPKSQLVYNSEIEKELNPQKVATRERTNAILKFLGILGFVLILIVLANVFGINERINTLLTAQISKKGAIVVTTEFTKAEVFLNEKSIGTTPLEANALVPGEYKLTIKVSDNTNEFFAPLVIPINVFGGNTTVVKAQPGPTEESSSYVVITSQDRGSSPFNFIATSLPNSVGLYLEEQKLGETPFTKSDFENGTKKLRLTREGYRDVEVEIDANGNRLTTVSVKLYKYVIKL